MPDTTAPVSDEPTAADLHEEPHLDPTEEDAGQMAREFADDLDDDLDDDLALGACEHYVDADLYDYEYRRRRDDVHFYRAIATELMGEWARNHGADKNGIDNAAPHLTIRAPKRSTKRFGTVLELACGSGRITSALLRAGHGVVGVDISQPMLQKAGQRFTRLGRAARARAALVCADMRYFAMEARFPVIFMAFNAFEHLYTRTDVAACLNTVRRHLAPGGTFVFDVQNPDMHWLMRDPRKRWSRTRFTHPRTGQRMIYSTNHDYDAVSQIVLIRLYYETEADTDTDTGSASSADEQASVTQVVTLSQRKFFPAELEALLHANGFTISARYGDFQRGPLDNDSESQIVVCRPR